MQVRKNLFLIGLFYFLLGFGEVPLLAQVSNQKTPVIIVDSPEALKEMHLPPGTRVIFRGGGGDAGGSNTIKNEPISQLQKKTSQIKEYRELVEPLIKSIESDIPAFAEVLKARAEDLRWYIIPIENKELPVEATGIPVPTDQNAIQIRDEVFVDESRWAQQSTLERRNTIIQEILESQFFKIRSNINYVHSEFRDKISMADVRKITELVQEYNPRRSNELQTALFEYNFGYYLTRVQTEKRNSELRGYIAQLRREECQRSTPMLSSLGKYLYSIKAETAGCLFFAGACPIPQKYGEKLSVESRSGLVAWARLSVAFPKELSDLARETSSSGNIEVDSIKAFDLVYPRLRGTTRDREMGAQVCQKLMLINLQDLWFSNGSHIRPLK